MPHSQDISKGKGKAKKFLTSTFKPFKNAFANLKDAGILAVSFLSSVLFFLIVMGWGATGG
jgi:hypothetical protein